jgi:vacuolar-type H+-ATPase subunit E/Vma4
MPKKNSIINNTPPQEKILIEDEEPEPPQPELTKPKRQISDAQREHLNNIRSKALEKKAQMKEETLKAKLAQTLEKKELVKKYDEYAEKEKEIPKPPEKKC